MNVDSVSASMWMTSPLQEGVSAMSVSGKWLIDDVGDLGDVFVADIP